MRAWEQAIGDKEPKQWNIAIVGSWSISTHVEMHWHWKGFMAFNLVIRGYQWKFLIPKFSDTSVEEIPVHMKRFLYICLFFFCPYLITSSSSSGSSYLLPHCDRNTNLGIKQRTESQLTCYIYSRFQLCVFVSVIISTLPHHCSCTPLNFLLCCESISRVYLHVHVL